MVEERILNDNIYKNNSNNKIFEKNKKNENKMK